MGEFPAAQVNAHVSHLVRRMKKDQVARTQVLEGHRLAAMDLQGGGTREFDVKKVAKDALYEPGAIDAASSRPSHPVRGALPLVDGRTQADLDRRPRYP